MPQGDIYKVNMFSHTSQRQVINTFYYEAGVIVTTDPFEEAEALGEAFRNALMSAFRQILSTGTSIGCIKIEKVRGSEIPTFILFLDNFVGFRAGGPLPANIIATISRRATNLQGPQRSMLFITGLSVTDSAGSFVGTAFFNAQFSDFVNLLNDTIVSTSPFQLAEFIPVLPHTEYVYARKIPVTGNVATNVLTLTDGTNWSTRGFITGPSFRILAPSKNRGTYFATVVPLSADLSLTANELEFAPAETISAQQVTTPVDYFTLQSSIGNIALRQLNRRRSSHTGIVA